VALVNQCDLVVHLRLLKVRLRAYRLIFIFRNILITENPGYCRCFLCENPNRINKVSYRFGIVSHLSKTSHKISITCKFLF